MQSIRDVEGHGSRSEGVINTEQTVYTLDPRDSLPVTEQEDLPSFPDDFSDFWGEKSH